MKGMATLHGDLPKAASELCLARACQRLPEGWHLFFNVHWIYRDDILHAELPGEADAVVYHPEHGIAVIEVKGGGIRREGERWFSIDSHRRWHPIQSPLEQASHGVFAFRRGLKAISRRILSATGEVPQVPRIEAMVCFPDIPPLGEEDVFGEDLPRRAMIDFRDLGRLEERLITWLSWPSPWTHRPPPEAYHREICQFFHPQARSVPLLREAIRNESALYERAQVRQERILRAVRDNDRLLVTGAAGTGKAELAMSRAGELASRGRRTALLCENPLLAQKLALRPELHAVEVHDRQEFLEGVLRKTGLEPQEGTMAERLPQALSMLPQLRWDALVCLEAERFPDWSWPLLESTLADGAGMSLTLFQDPFAVPENAVPTWPSGLARCCLERVVRRTRAISGWLASHCELHLDIDPGCPAGEPVRERAWRRPEEQELLLREELHRLISQEGLEPAQIAVLSAAPAREASPLRDWKDVRLKWVARIGGWSADKAVLLPAGLASACEAEAVVLVDVGSETDPRTLYLLASRARHLLTVLARV
jgi:hypothetical protein